MFLGRAPLPVLSRLRSAPRSLRRPFSSQPIGCPRPDTALPSRTFGRHRACPPIVPRHRHWYASASTGNASASPRSQRPERVRFAPSPTGHLHVGGARTALFNWLFARHHGGKFILRIEDTDVARSSVESEQAMLRDLHWLGLDWDEGPQRISSAADASGSRSDAAPSTGEHGPYRQSERGALYQAAVKRLVDMGAAYPCFCTEEELERKRREAEAAGRPPQYDGTWRDADPALVQQRMRDGCPYTLRFRVPERAVITIDDVVRGPVSWDANATVGDFIIMRSTGVPVYNFCVAVDDALMGITTVIRAEEHLTNTLRQALILDALGYARPRYAHVSLILGEDRQKLSKRHGATSIDQFAQMGYLPEAMANYLALLGWNDGTERELFAMSELVEAFELERVTKSAAVFDVTKLRWMNGLHLRAMSPERLRATLTPLWAQAGLVAALPSGAAPATATAQSEGVMVVDPRRSRAFLAHTSELLRGSLELANDSVPLLRQLLEYPLAETLSSGDADELLTDEGGFYPVAREVLAAYDAQQLPLGSGSALSPDDDDDAEHAFDDDDDEAAELHATAWKTWVNAFGKRLKRKGKKLFHPLRLAVTGRMSGPDVGSIVRMLYLADRGVAPGAVLMPQRMQVLRQTLAASRQAAATDAMTARSPQATS